MIKKKRVAAICKSHKRVMMQTTRDNTQWIGDGGAMYILAGIAPMSAESRGKGEVMKKVYICSRYRADDKHTIEENVAKAFKACGYAASIGYAPYAPHLYLPRCLDDDKPEERELGLRIGMEFLKFCDEIWQCDTDISEGMATELALAEELDIPVRVFGEDLKTWTSTIYAKWVNVKKQVSSRSINPRVGDIKATCTSCGLEHSFKCLPLPSQCHTCGARMDRKATGR